MLELEILNEEVMEGGWGVYIGATRPLHKVTRSSARSTSKNAKKGSYQSCVRRPSQRGRSGHGPARALGPTSRAAFVRVGPCRSVFAQFCGLATYLSVTIFYCFIFSHRSWWNNQG